MPRTTKAYCAVLLAALAAGCGRDAAGPEQARLGLEATLEITSVLFGELFAAGFGVDIGEWSGAGVPAGAPLFSLMPTEEISATAPCELGGTMSFQGTINDELDDEGKGTFAMDLRQAPHDCVVSTSEGPFTVNGDPHLRLSVAVTVPQGVEITAFAVSFSGGFRWSGQPGSGRCGVDVTFVVDVEDLEASTVTGKLCGHDVSA